LGQQSGDQNAMSHVLPPVKHWLRQAQARSIEEIYQSLGPILERFKPLECAAYLENSGYAST
jgi:hypothetical protein